MVLGFLVFAGYGYGKHSEYTVVDAYFSTNYAKYRDGPGALWHFNDDDCHYGRDDTPRRCNHVYRVLFDERICQELYERVGAIFSRGINSRDTFNGVSTSRAIFTEPAYGLKKGVIVLSQMLSIPGSGGPCSP
jgi:hypothetical protein